MRLPHSRNVPAAVLVILAVANVETQPAPAAEKEMKAMSKEKQQVKDWKNGNGKF